MLTESVDSTILPLMFSSPTTSTMSFLTSVDLYCLYPSLASKNLALKGFNQNNDIMAQMLQKGITVTSTMQQYGLMCTPETCLSVMREWNDNRSRIGKLKWNGSCRSVSWRKHMYGSSYHWRRAIALDTKSCTCGLANH